MWTIFTAALGLGMIGSLHCIGMCGPLALALPIPQTHLAGKFWGTLLYQLGRVTTYTGLGLLLGLIGKTFNLLGLQQGLSIGLGLLLLGMLLLPKIMPSIQHPRLLEEWGNVVRKALGKQIAHRHHFSLLIIGMLNGLLPCGLVYMAAATATATGSPESSALFMAGFGMGTLPAMWFISFFGHALTGAFRLQLKKWQPILMTLMACLLIVRGLGLGIPYVSPAQQKDNHSAVECHPTAQQLEMKGTP